MKQQEGKVNDFIYSSLRAGKGREHIEQHLIQLGHEERFVKEIVAETLKLHNTRQRATGLAFILAGALVCFASCVLTLIHVFSQESFSMVLFGFTSVGIILIFWGFMKIF